MEKKVLEKFQLKKLYPGSPELGTIVKHNGRGYSNDQPTFYAPVEIVENQPEFWQKVEEKEYEILNYLSHGLTKNKPSIYSVKRLSDGSVFTIGDKYYPNKDKEFVDTIQKFEFVLGDTLRIQGTNSYMGLEDIVKAKFLFKTEDGVDIYSGDKSYLVVDFKLKDYYIWHGDYKGAKYFSTKEAAEKYIEENKPKTFKTEDGFEVGVGDKIYSVLTKGSWDYSDFVVHYPKVYFSDSLKYFKLKENRDKYREENIPKYSEKDMLDFGAYIDYSSGLTTISEDLMEWKKENNK